MKRNGNAPATPTLARHATEVYCRRDNRVYPVCPHADDPASCPCLAGLETADSLFESVDDEEESVQ